MGNQTPSTKCHTCSVIFSTFNSSKTCIKCNNLYCKKCIDNPVHLQQNSSSYINGTQQNIKITTLCLSCFKNNTSINFNSQIDIIGSQNKNTIIWLHGGGSSRKMFESHAQALSQHGYRSLLIDLPGHGALMDVKLTKDSCIEQVNLVFQKYCQIKNPPILIGGSFGGYLIMQIFNKYPNNFKAAIICMCGQNVGAGRSSKASFGLWAMGKAMNLISKQKIVESLIKQAKFIEKVQLSKMMRSGYYFNQAQNQIQFLKNCNCVQGLKKFQGKILFINGSKDYRDSQQIWLKTAKKGDLKIYEGGDHFFSHDKRYMKQFINDCLEFCNSVWKQLQSE